MSESEKWMQEYRRLNRIAKISGRKEDYLAAQDAHKRYLVALGKEV